LKKWLGHTQSKRFVRERGRNLGRGGNSYCLVQKKNTWKGEKHETDKKAASLTEGSRYKKRKTVRPRNFEGGTGNPGCYPNHTKKKSGQQEKHGGLIYKGERGVSKLSLLKLEKGHRL